MKQRNNSESGEDEMSEDIILRNTFFGGYKKKDAIQYIDKMLEENENKIKQMEEQISSLKKENRRLKEKNQEKTSYSLLTKSEKEMRELEDMPIANQMQLPEGNYIVSEVNEKADKVEKEANYENEIEIAADVAATQELQTVNEPKMDKESQDISKSQYEGKELKQLKSELDEVNAQLTKMKWEKERFMAKLEYSNELLLELYKRE